jgi:hypothetical protein
MKFRGYAGLAVLLGAVLLVTGCGDKDDSSPAPAPVTTKAPVTPAGQASDAPSTPADETKGGGSAADFCKTLLSKQDAMGVGKDATTLSDDAKRKVADTVAELADQAPADVKAPLTTMAKAYQDLADGKPQTDLAEQKKTAAASLKYVEWTVTHCPPPGG